MPNSVHSALVKPFELSSWAGILSGPNALMPAAVRSSTIPAASGVSGPTTTSSTALVLQKSITAAWSATSSATHSASRAIPALPGAHQNLVTRGEAAIFHARACSRPPEPSRRMCIEGSEMRGLQGAEVARIGVGLKGGLPQTLRRSRRGGRVKMRLGANTLRTSCHHLLVALECSTRVANAAEKHTMVEHSFGGPWTEIKLDAV